MEINNNLMTQHRLLSANPRYWDIDMSQVCLVKAAAIVKVALNTGIYCEVPVVTRAGQDGTRPLYKCHHGHTTMYAATKLYALGETIGSEAERRKHFERFEYTMCLLLNDEVRPCVPAFDEVQSDEWIAELLKPYTLLE